MGGFIQKKELYEKKRIQKMGYHVVIILYKNRP